MPEHMFCTLAVLLMTGLSVYQTMRMHLLVRAAGIEPGEDWYSILLDRVRHD